MKRITFIGDTTHHEFRDPLAWMREYCDLSVCGSIASAVETMSSSNALPEVIVLGQTWPRELSLSEIERLRLRAPSVRLVRLLGGWCEGELRTSPLKVTALYWHQFFSKLADDLRSAPATEAEAGLVVIRTSSHETYEAIAAVCDSLGHSTVWAPPYHLPHTTQAVAGIWDCRNSLDSDRELLAGFVRKLSPAPVIGLIGFPRREDSDSAFSAGVKAVVSKPFDNDDLANTLAQVTASSQTARRHSGVA